MAEYQYASGDLMGHPQNYFYTRFEGHEFLRAWRLSRQAALDSLPPPAESAPPFNAEAQGTARLLEAAFAESGSVRDSKGPLPFHAEKVLSKFEVGKRIYDRYDEQLRPVDRDNYRTIEYYVRAAECFEAVCARTGDLRALNVLLKCLDTLVAHRAELDARLGARLARLIASERQYVDRIAAERKIRFQ